MPRKAAHSRIESLAREWDEKAIATLGQIMMQPRAPEHARIQAANSLLNRGYGLPAAQVDVEHTAPMLEAFKEWMAWTKLIDVSPQHTISVSPNANEIKELDGSAVATALCPRGYSCPAGGLCQSCREGPPAGQK